MTEAQIALSEAKQHLKDAKDREPEVAQLTEASKKFRRDNHFAANLQTLFEGGPR